MHKIDLLILLFILGFLKGCAPEEKPNFIIWVADDQYLESVGCYGGDPAQTPHIDKLAREGLLFTRAYSTASICTPARSALYTGMYPIKNGSHPNHSGLKKDIPSMPSIMREFETPVENGDTLLLRLTSIGYPEVFCTLTKARG